MNNQQMQMTPTHHEKMEWARLAQNAYRCDQNDVGHRFSGAASIVTGSQITCAQFDALQADYRLWLIGQMHKMTGYKAEIVKARA